MHKARRPIHQYSERALLDALKSIREDGMSIREASRKYGVPRATLQDKLHNRVPETRKMGPSPILTDTEEAQLVQWLKDVDMCGFPGKKDDLLNTVQQIVINGERKTPFKNGRPGHKWYEAFMKRHPEIAVRTAEGITKGRAVVTEEAIRKWFKNLLSYLEQINATDILEDPRRILNGDETSFSLCPKTGKVLAPKGYKNVYNLQIGNEKETITVLLVFTASGLTATPMVVFPYIRPPKEVVNSVPDDWFLGRSETGWMKSEIFYEYVVNGVDKWLLENEIPKPVLLFVDGHKSHLTLELSTECANRNIILYSLPPNTTHILQPADVSVFKPLKEDWKKTVRDWQYEPENVNVSLTKANFCPLLKRVLSNENITASIKNGFRKCGLYPLDPDAVDYSKCVQNKLESLQQKLSETTGNEEKLKEYAVAQNVIEELRDKLNGKGLAVDLIIGCIEEEKEKFKPMGENSTSETTNPVLNLDENPPGLYEIEVGYSDDIGLICNEIILPTEHTDQPLTVLNPEENISYNPIVVAETGSSPNSALQEFEKSATDLDYSSYSADDHTYSINQTNDNTPVNLLLVFEDSNPDLLTPSKTLSHNDRVQNQTSIPLPIESSNSNVISFPDHCLIDSRTAETATSASPSLSANNLVTPSTSFPSPTNKTEFQSHLYYPTPFTKVNKKRTNTKKKLPISPPKAISSTAWREWYSNKEKERRNKEDMVRKRKEERQRIAQERELQKSQKKSRPRKKAKKTVCGKESNIAESTDENIAKPTEKTEVTSENMSIGEKSYKEKIICKECKEELVSDVEEDDLKNIGCVNCSNWFHLKCTEFRNRTYESVVSEDFKCHLC